MLQYIPIALFAVTALAPAFVRAAPVPRQTDFRPETRVLQGTWRGVFLHEDGTADTYSVTEVTLVFEKSAFTLAYKVDVAPGEVARLVYKGTYKVYPRKNPPAIDMQLTKHEGRKVDGKRLHGIYEVNKEGLKWCVSEVGKKDRPRRFATRPQGDWLLFEFKKQRQR